MNTELDQYMDIFKDGRDVHSLLNMVSKSWVLASLILMPKTA